MLNTLTFLIFFQVFARDTVHFAGQAIGLVVAETKAIARRAAALVKVNYTQVAPPVLTIGDALKTQPEARKQSTFSPASVHTGDADGTFRIKNKTHFFIANRHLSFDFGMSQLFCHPRIGFESGQPLSTAVRPPSTGRGMAARWRNHRRI